MNFKWLRIALPIVVLVALGIVLAKGLQYDPRALPSAKINKPVPKFALPELGVQDDGQVKFTPESMRGKVWVLNVFASWCTACLTEHATLIKLASTHNVSLVGLAYKDAPVDTQQWLQEHGNPYSLVALDVDGNVGIDFGVYGVPETYVIDGEGIIRYRHVGALNEDFYEAHVVPVMMAADAAPVQSSNAALGQKNQAAAVASDARTMFGLEKSGSKKLTATEMDVRIRALAAELRCLVCQNQTIADSTAALAVDLKRQISEQISAGKTDDEIKDYMLERYGEFVLYDPPFNAKNAALWSLPFLLMLIAFGVAWRTYKANQKAGEVKGGGSPPRALSSKRLKELESQYRNSGEG